MSSNVTVGAILVSSRPVRSPYFSPSLTNTSSRRRWSAHSFSLRSGWAMTSDRRATRRCAGVARLLEDALLDEHRHLRADRQRDRVRRSGVELELGPARAQIDRRVEDVVAHVRDDDTGEGDLEPAEQGQEEVVGERPRRRHALERYGDRDHLGGPDADRHQALVALALELDRRLLGDLI